jgi:hypothetical protein
MVRYQPIELVHRMDRLRKAVFPERAPAEQV